ncbi:MAG TPA: flagellar motor protein MotA, partial [Nitrosomonas sp.]|nr:flagellar motor protein MotA [Nitrosomonas sp.]
MKNIIISGLLLCGIIASAHAKEDSNPKLTEPSAVENQATSETITAPKKQNNAAPKQRSVDLETAYKREYAFL